MDTRPDKLIIHHTADGYNGPQFYKVNEWHKIQNFPKSSMGYFCGYHFLIERDGTVIQARSIFEEGAHCKGENLDSIGICLAGNFDFEQPTEEQKESLGKLCLSLMTMLKIPITEIWPHRKYKNTSCYGQLLNDKWAQYNLLHYELNLIKKAILWLKITLAKQ